VITSRICLPRHLSKYGVPEFPAVYPEGTVCAVKARCESRRPVLKSQQGLEITVVKSIKLSVDIKDPMTIPYFLWDEPMTVAELKKRLRTASRPERSRLLGKILREARDTDVWNFTNPDEVRQMWPELRMYLGRRRAFWEFLLKRWQIEGFLA
jgi:hypothetical protein